MTLAEFKAWFDGYTEDMQHPNHKQWKRIQEQVAAIDDKPTITEKVFIDRYVRPYWDRPYWYTTGGGYCGSGVQVGGVTNMPDTKTYGDTVSSFVVKADSCFDSRVAFNALGKMEAEYERTQQA